MSYKSTVFQQQDIADDYVKFRPTYSREVFETIMTFCQETGTCDFSLALDLGCGSGQSTVPLAKHFKRVIGLDVSQAQVDRAPKDIPNLSFRVGLAEDLSFLEDGCVDLVTVATSVQWMDVEKLFLEVERILKPGGAFVVYSYNREILHETDGQRMSTYYWDNVAKAAFPDESKLYLENFKDFKLPFPGWSRDDSMKIERNWTLEQYFNYMSTLSVPDSRLSLLSKPVDSVLSYVKQRLTEVYQNGPEEQRVKITWPVHMFKGHKPQNPDLL